MINRIFFTGILALVLPFVAHAAGGMSVVFETNPLFSVGDFMPGATTSRTVTVTNNGSVARDVYVGTNGTGVDGGLGEALTLGVVSGSDTSLYAGTVAAFIATSSIHLDTIGAGETKVYTCSVAFVSGVDAYQGKSVGFDIVFGFSQNELTESSSGGGGGSAGVTGSTGGSNSVPVGRVLGLADGFDDGSDTPRAAVHKQLTEAREALAALVGQVLGVVDEASTTEEVVSLSPIGTTSAETAVDDADSCLFYRILPILWLIGSVLTRRTQQNPVGRPRIFATIQWLAGIASLVILSAYLIVQDWCMIPPALVTLLGVVLASVMCTRR